MDTQVTLKDIQGFKASFDANPGFTLARNAVVKSGVDAAVTDYAHKQRMRHQYSIELPQGKITNQESSGRCWMFAALNMMRCEVMKKLNLETFEFSENFPLFYDKLEKSNHFLECILETLGEATDSRLIAFLLAAPLGDGGQWDMFVSLVEKYGVCPKDQMPETASSSATAEMTRFMTKKLREFACLLREAHAAGESADALRARKAGMMQTIYNILCVCLGEPPASFVFETRDKDKKFLRDGPVTPVEFFKKYVALDLSEYISLINAPTKDKPYNKTYTVRFLGNVRGGRAVKYLNVTTGEMKQAAINQMQDGGVVWFGCDVGQDHSRDWGAMDTKARDYEAVFGTMAGMTKAQRLDYGDSLMTHAMVFTGVNIDDGGKPNRWRVENSWGDKRGNEGLYIMSDDWFDEYNYQVVVKKRYLPKETAALYELEPIELNPWDPMGSLAL